MRMCVCVWLHKDIDTHFDIDVDTDVDTHVYTYVHTHQWVDRANERNMDV